LREFNFQLTIFHGESDVHRSRRVIKLLLDTLFWIDVSYLIANPQTPKLYESGIVYKREPAGRENWQDIGTNLKELEADCEDLACHRAAELYVFGHDKRVRPYLVYRTFGKATLYHVKVKHGNGTLEDPSAKLGMGKDED